MTISKMSKLKKRACIGFQLILFGILTAHFVPVNAFAVSTHDLFDYWVNLYGSISRQANPLFDHELLAKAQPDECFYSIGDPRNQYLARTCNDGTWKVNQTLIWGLTKSDRKLWFGILSNSRCTTGGDPILGKTPFQFDSYVCEFGEGPWCPPIPVAYGDWRPPSVYAYDLDKGKVVKHDLLVPGTKRGLPFIHGIRGAGSLDGIVFLGGGSGIPGTPVESVTLLAYNSGTEEFLGWHKLKDSTGKSYFNIRKWLTFNGHLYVCVWKENGGHILRWLGDPKAIRSGDLTTLWKFEEVGHLDSNPANITVYEGNRLAVATRPVGTRYKYRGGNLWLSPEFDNHLTASDADNWQKIWSTADYDPDFVTAMVTGVGDLRYFDGYLWWGTQHIPGVAWFYHQEIYSNILDNYPDDDQKTAAFYGTWRPTIVFRGRNLGTPSQEIDVVYGFKELPKFVIDAKSNEGHWEIVPNKMGGNEPLMGTGGFGNWYQFYTFTMEVHNNRLFVGTNEISMRFAEEDSPIPMPIAPDESLWGGELWRFTDADSPAIGETISGFGNYLNTSIRNMVSDDDTLYVGTGNPHNLLTDPNDDLPEGGWELIKLK